MKNFIELMIDKTLYIVNIDNIASVKQITAYQTEVIFLTKEKNEMLRCTIPMNYGLIKQTWFENRLLTDVAIYTVK